MYSEDPDAPFLILSKCKLKKNIFNEYYVVSIEKPLPCRANLLREIT